MSLVEVMIALFIVGVGLMALASTAITSVQSVRISRERQDAMQLASSVIEGARAQKFAAIALEAATYTGGSTHEGETVVAVPGGLVPHEMVQGPLTARSWVTWVDATTVDEKRITTEVTWRDGGQTRTVEQSTIVAEARRGLPVPNFQVTPALSTTDAVEGEVVCFDHTLTNLGEQDSYSWQLLRTNSSGTLVAATFTTRADLGQGFDVADGTGPGSGWFAWAQMGPTTTTLANMVDQTSDGRPDSFAPVPRRSDNVLRVCYTPYTSTGTLRTSDAAPRFTVRIHSAFDETVLREVEDSFVVITSQQRLYLHHTYRNNGAPELENQHKYKLLMDGAVPLGTNNTLSYDSDVVPGLRVPATGVQYYYQNISGVSRVIVPEPARFQGAIASSSSRTGTPAGDVTLTLTVVHQTTSGATVVGTKTTTFTPSGASWTWVDEDIELGTVTLAPNEYLRLDLGCTTATGEGCHIHYDVKDKFPSSLTVTVQ